MDIINAEKRLDYIQLVIILQTVFICLIYSSVYDIFHNLKM